MSGVDGLARSSGRLRDLAPAFGVALSMTVIFISVLGIFLAVASTLELSGTQLTAWVLGGYGIPSVLSLVLAARYRQPLLLTGNIFMLIFIASLGTQLTYPELIGASMVAGACVLVLGPLGVIHRLAAWLPAPVVFGLLAGAVTPFVVGIFTALGDERLIVGGAFLAYLAGRRLLEPRIPAILAALAVGITVAGVAGDLGAAPTEMAWPIPVLTAPQFSLRAVITATPVMVVLITLQANVPSLVFLRGQRYRPPDRTITVVSGAGTLLGSLLGPIGVSLSLPATAITAGADAGAHRVRHRAVYLAACAGVAIALLSGFTGELAAIIPRELILALAGLAMVGVLAGALQQVARGPLMLGPMFAFVVALSDLSLFGLGSFFWALVVGLGISLLLERDQWRRLQVSLSQHEPSSEEAPLGGEEPPRDESGTS